MILVSFYSILKIEFSDASETKSGDIFNFLFSLERHHFGDPFLMVQVDLRYLPNTQVGI